MVGGGRSAVPTMVELDGGPVLLLPAGARGRDGALGAQRRAFGHGAHRQLTRPSHCSPNRILKRDEPPAGVSSSLLVCEYGSASRLSRAWQVAAKPQRATGIARQIGLRLRPMRRLN